MHLLFGIGLMNSEELCSGYGWMGKVFSNFFHFLPCVILRYKSHVRKDSVTYVVTFCPSVASFILKCQSSSVNSERMFM